MATTSNIGEAVRRARQGMGLRQDELAAAAGGPGCAALSQSQGATTKYLNEPGATGGR